MNTPRNLMIAAALPHAHRRDASIKRADIREILGSKTMREITLK